MPGKAAVWELEDQGENDLEAAEVAVDDQRMEVDAVVLELEAKVGMKWRTTLWRGSSEY